MRAERRIVGTIKKNIKRGYQFFSSIMLIGFLRAMISKLGFATVECLSERNRSAEDGEGGVVSLYICNVQQAYML